MIDINSATLTGRLVREPQIYPKNGTSGFAVFTIAANYQFKGRDGEPQKEVAFVPCKAFGLWAASLEGRRKGDLLVVSGRLRSEQWEKDGTTHRQLTLVCDAVHAVTRAPRAGLATTAGLNASTGEDDDIPF